MSFHLAAKDVSWAALTAFSLRRLFRPLPSAIRPLIAKRHDNLVCSHVSVREAPSVRANYCCKYKQ
ncbi:unnamed protein product [Larinioides sclopetarius]|uniref:Uncharacterized protein n=1 Tax=Larinioides sclopetarius TaxID=280406 RepID=A0AAV1ZGD0_9ARAC